MEKTAQLASTVYVVLACGTDYYDQLEFHSVYATQEAAEAKAAELRVAVDEFGLFEGELQYSSVCVLPSALN
jgi:hypothetical protein